VDRQDNVMHMLSAREYPVREISQRDFFSAAVHHTIIWLRRMHALPPDCIDAS